MEAGFLQAIRDDPTDELSWLVLADWLEEHDQSARAELLRLREELRKQTDVPDRPAKEKRLQQLLAKRVEPTTVPWQIELPSGVTLLLSLIPPGAFLMGSAAEEKERYENESPRHKVTIKRPFFIGVYPVTQLQWRALMGDNPSTTRDDDRPVESVSWPECQEFCSRLSERLGQLCRLPFEAEWEYACRAGTTTAFYTGNGHAAMKRAGWCSYRGESGSARRTKPVGRYLPNAYGLYDMHGNVREWCQDDLRTYTRKPRVDPQGQLTGNHRVVRGGSWYYGPEDSRSACRYSRPIDYHLDYYGCRIVVPCE